MIAPVSVCAQNVEGQLTETVVEPEHSDDRRPFPHSEDHLLDYFNGRRTERLESEQQGEPSRTKQWNRTLPLLGQQVVDLGFDLPNPFGVSVIYVMVEQDQDLKDLKVRLGGGDETDIDFIDFGDAVSDAQTYQLRLDAWLFPFMNIYGLLGEVDGDGDVPFAVPADEALKILVPPVGSLCDGPPPLRPEFCDETLSAVVNVDYEGTNWGVGTLLAGGWSDYFIALNFSYVVTDIDNLEEDSEAWNTSARVGYLGELGGFEYALFTGIDYLKAESDAVGTASYDLTSVDPIGRVLTVDYEVYQSNAEATNYFVGMNLDFSRSLHMTGQYGFGGSRDQVVLAITLRL